MVNVEWITANLALLEQKLLAVFDENRNATTRINNFQETFQSEFRSNLQTYKDLLVDNKESCETDKMCTIGENLKQRTKKQKLLPIKFNLNGKTRNFSVIGLKTEWNNEKITCCNKCYFNSKLWTLIEIGKFAQIEIPLTNEKDKPLIIFGVKSRLARGEDAYYLNSLAIEFPVNKQTYLHLIAWNGEVFKFLRLEKDSIDSFTGSYKKTIYKYRGDITDITNDKLDLDVTLINLNNIYTDKSEMFQEAYSNQIKTAFLKAYPRQSKYPAVPEIIRMKEAAVKLKKKKVSENKEKEVFAKITVDLTNTGIFLIAVSVISIIFIILIVRELRSLLIENRVEKSRID